MFHLSLFFVIERKHTEIQKRFSLKSNVQGKYRWKTAIFRGFVKLLTRHPDRMNILGLPSNLVLCRLQANYYHDCDVLVT
jgi:hypothetical protein